MRPINIRQSHVSEKHPHLYLDFSCTLMKEDGRIGGGMDERKINGLSGGSEIEVFVMNLEIALCVSRIGLN